MGFIKNAAIALSFLTIGYIGISTFFERGNFEPNIPQNKSYTNKLEKTYFVPMTSQYGEKLNPQKLEVIIETEGNFITIENKLENFDRFPDEGLPNFINGITKTIIAYPEKVELNPEDIIGIDYILSRKEKGWDMESKPYEKHEKAQIVIGEALKIGEVTKEVYESITPDYLQEWISGLWNYFKKTENESGKNLEKELGPNYNIQEIPFPISKKMSLGGNVTAISYKIPFITESIKEGTEIPVGITQKIFLGDSTINSGPPLNQSGEIQVGFYIKLKKESSEKKSQKTPAKQNPVVEKVFAEKNSLKRSQDKIIFSRKKNTNWDIYSINPDRTEERNLTNTPDLNERKPCWFPDKKRIIYLQLETNQEDKLVILNLYTNKKTKLPWKIKNRKNAIPIFIPDEEKIILYRFSEDSHPIFDIRNNTQSEIISSSLPVLPKIYPTLSEKLKTKKLFFMGNRIASEDNKKVVSENSEKISIMNPDRTNRNFLTDGIEPNWDNYVIFEPDGKLGFYPF